MFQGQEAILIMIQFAFRIQIGKNTSKPKPKSMKVPQRLQKSKHSKRNIL